MGGILCQHFSTDGAGVCVVNLLFNRTEEALQQKFSAQPGAVIDALAQARALCAVHTQPLWRARCPDCFPNRQQQLAAGRTAEDLYERTVRRLWELEHVYGCELHVVWACEWKQQLRRDPQLKQRYDSVFVARPLDPRNDALRGGRTEPFKLHHVCGADEEILCLEIWVITH
uniref:Uncharacterized protein n=1 Tax=Globodera rostochiensis TaxID=31243 RepID=A0A914HYC9_GLORO